jgi:hypothetical protein
MLREGAVRGDRALRGPPSSAVAGPRLTQWRV